MGWAQVTRDTEMEKAEDNAAARSGGVVFWKPGMSEDVER